MTTKEIGPPVVSEKLHENLARIEGLSARLVAAMAQKKMIRPSLQAPGPEFVGKALGAYWPEMMTNPAKVWEQQIDFWGKTLKHAVEAQQALPDGDTTLVPEDHAPNDRRFSNPLWQTHPYFNFLKQQYLIAADAIEKGVDAAGGDRRRRQAAVGYFTQQIIDMMAPTNFLATNPEALEKAIETEGQSLIDGLENMVPRSRGA